MSEQFKVGDAIYGHGFKYSPDRNGMFGVIKSGGYNSECQSGVVRLAYSVEWADGTVRAAAAYCLRRRKPPTTGEQSIISMFDKAPQRVGETV